MRSGQVSISNRHKLREEKAPSLVDLCVLTAIDNIRYIGDVGATDSHLLERILPHCTVEQLMHIENVTEDRDLSPVTDKLWEKFYKVKFSELEAARVVREMARTRVKFGWRQLYQAKLKTQEEARMESLERLAQSFKQDNARKQSRQIQICTKLPPSSKKRSFGGGFGASSSFSNVRSNIMKKAKVEYSAEIRNRTVTKKPIVHVQRTYSPSVKKPPVAREKTNVPHRKFP